MNESKELVASNSGFESLKPDWNVQNVFTEDFAVNNTYVKLNNDPVLGDLIF